MQRYPVNRNAKSLDSNGLEKFFTRALWSRLNFYGLLLLSIWLWHVPYNANFVVSGVVSLTHRSSQMLVQTVRVPYVIVYQVRNIFSRIGELERKNAVLLAENQRLQRINLHNKYLQKENNDLRQLLQMADYRVNSYQAVSIAAPVNSLMGKYLLINYGRKHKAKEGEMVTGAVGLVGRVTSITHNKSLVILLDNIKSHIPVISEHSGIRGILVGNGSAYPEIINAESNADLKFIPGEMIYTSGDDGFLVPSVPIGVIRSSNGTRVSVKLLENPLALDKLTVLKY